MPYSYKTYLLWILPLVFGAGTAIATGHFPHESGNSGAWYWKDVSGYYSAHTKGRSSEEHLNVFCNGPEAGGVAIGVSVPTSQVGNRRLTFEFDTGRKIDVIANYGKVTSSESAGARIIRDVIANLRSANSVVVTQQDAPPAVFSLRGSSHVLERCP